MASHTIQDNVNYVIANVKSGTLIDLNPTDRNTVTAWEKNGGDNQKWTMRHMGLDTYEIISYLTLVDPDPKKIYLGVEVHDCTPVISASTTIPYMWNVVRDSEGDTNFRIFLPRWAPGRNIELKDGNGSNGSTIQLNTIIDEQSLSQHQLWTFTEA